MHRTYRIIGGVTLTVTATQTSGYLDPYHLTWSADGPMSEALSGRLDMLPRIWRQPQSDYSEAQLDGLVRSRLLSDEDSPPVEQHRDDQRRLHWDRRDGFDPSRWTKE